MGNYKYYTLHFVYKYHLDVQLYFMPLMWDLGVFSNRRGVVSINFMNCT
jgi:hypothetical protein